MRVIFTLVVKDKRLDYSIPIAGLNHHSFGRTKFHVDRLDCI